MTATQLFSHDFDALSEGERFSTRGRTITEADVVAFATLTGDLHPAHSDAVWAAKSHFGERIAHGMLVISYAVGLVPLDPERIVALRRLGDVVFKQPTRFGDTIRVDGHIAQLNVVSDEMGLVGCVWKIVNQHDKTVARANVDVLWRRGDSSGPELVAESVGEAAAL